MLSFFCGGELDPTIPTGNVQANTFITSSNIFLRACVSFNSVSPCAQGSYRQERIPRRPVSFGFCITPGRLHVGSWLAYGRFHNQVRLEGRVHQVWGGWERTVSHISQFLIVDCTGGQSIYCVIRIYHILLRRCLLQERKAR